MRWDQRKMNPCQDTQPDDQAMGGWCETLYDSGTACRANYTVQHNCTVLTMQMQACLEAALDHR